jgi:hypothetical protein
VAPTSSALELSDAEYRISARLNLGLQPMANAAAMPDVCLLCKASKFNLNSIRDDPWHFLACPKLSKGELSIRHDGVGHALYRCALLMGIRAQLEPTGLDPNSDLRPDVLLTLPGRQILTDVAIAHPLAPGAVRAEESLRKLGRARRLEAKKRRKYRQLSSMRHYEQLPFIVETCGGAGPSADVLIKTMADASVEHLAMWSKDAVIRELVSSVAIAVQRGGALAYLDGYEKTLRAMRVAPAAAAGAVKKKAARLARDESEDEEEGAGGHGQDDSADGEEHTTAVAA